MAATCLQASRTIRIRGCKAAFSPFRNFSLQGESEHEPQRANFHARRLNSDMKALLLSTLIGRSSSSWQQPVGVFERVGKFGEPARPLGRRHSAWYATHICPLASWFRRCTLIGSRPPGPFWSRNRLTFLHNARYQGHARSRFSSGGNPYGCVPDRCRQILQFRWAASSYRRDSESAMARAECTIGALDLRIGARLPMGDRKGAHREAVARRPSSGSSLTATCGGRWTSF